MLTYEVCFRISLFPEGVQGFHFEEDGNYGEFVEDYEVFDKYLCTESQSQFVVDELNSVYRLLSGDTVTELRYEDNGKFNCKITLQNYGWLKDKTGNQLESYIEELLWPADIHDSAFMFINEKPVNLQIEIDWLEKREDELEDELEEDDLKKF